ncbi:hypothetical protein [Flavobacterium sp.]|uniref:hypothetical protein n=1 Tax=Flavobacterium sp. TaxID=239 RepID=UPI0031E45711
MIKKILPFEELFYRSQLSKQDLLAHLENEIEAEKSFGFSANNFSYSKPYVGKIYGNKFKIKRAINYRNSFLPIIKGEIKEDISGSKIIVKMSLVEFVKVFMIIWLGGAFIACIAVTYNILFNNGLNSEAGFFMLIPYGMLLLGIAMAGFGFKVESKKSTQDLEKILQAKIVER